MDTIFGIRWRIADYTEILLAFIIILVILTFFGLLRYNQRLKNEKIQAEQLFLFKIKQLGLSNFQVKILDGLVHTLRLPDASMILENQGLFESAIGSFLAYLKSRGEKEDSLTSICRDLIITYEKLYNQSTFRTPLQMITEMEIGLLLFITTKSGTIFIGKITQIEPGQLTLATFRSTREINILEGTDADAFVWRAGDAEYSFKTRTLSIADKSVSILLPEEFNRGKEVRHPFIDTIIPCTITKIAAAQLDSIKNDTAPLSAVIHKIHQDELIVRTSRKLDYRQSYTIDFILSDFKMRITAIVIADRTIQEENVFYLTFRYTEISEAARSLLKKYIQEHL
ncbi:MAG TPA: hypothetical protein VLM75_04695 [Spirochaetota bacterium]|nr:hypothetical protein [Spirochaetota bacterium]